MADAICSRLRTGEPMASICRDESMPAVRTVGDWKDANPAFAASIARAREEGFDALAAECLEIANTPLEGIESTTKPNGDVEEKRGDMLGHRKLQIETRLKLLAKWDPKRYGDKMQIAGDPDAPLETRTTLNVAGLSTDALAEIMAARDAAKPR
ncbi:terminase [Pseudorhodoferax sp. Leaf274]|uniref:terminase small subunit-like protein n=1 Tax=Pseudorhodoferax sp. Leaf274 TaxID=1736318 RepID=UPI003514E887